jgi:hypothetical protein
MKSLIRIVFLISLLYFSCRPPESVRSQDYREKAADGYFAHIPIGVIAHDLALGETVEETEMHLGSRLELEETQNEEIKLARFLIRHPAITADTLITCGFKNGRLTAVHAKTTFLHSIKHEEDFLDETGKVFSFIPELKNYVNFDKSMHYVQSDNIMSCSYDATKTSDGFNRFEYLISYTSDIETFDLILNS